MSNPIESNPIESNPTPLPLDLPAHLIRYRATSNPAKVYRTLEALKEAEFPTTYHCRECGLECEVEGCCPNHPDAIVESILPTLVEGKNYTVHTLHDSGSCKAEPRDTKCRYWAKLVQAAGLPNPGNVEGANDLPGSYLKLGPVEVFAGQYLIEGEANHRTKNRGWAYNAYRVNWTGVKHEICYILNDNADIRAKIKSNDKLTPEQKKRLLSGSGDLAAVVRACFVDALALGWL